MKPLLLLSFACLLLCFAACQPAADPGQEEWISLFNGTDLTGWDLKITGRDLNDNYLNTIRVEDSMIRVVYDDYEEFGTYFGHLYYEKPFSYYRLLFEYRFTGEQTKGGAVWNNRNSGVMLHSQSAQSLGYNQHFPVSIELQMLGGLGEGERNTANLCTPGTYVQMNGVDNHDHCINSTSKTYDGDQWIQVEALVLGDSIIHHIIGPDTVLTYTKPMVDSVFVGAGAYNWTAAGVTDSTYWLERAGQTITSGHIALQAESHPVDFRNIRLLELEGCMDPKATNYKSYFVHSVPEKCKYR